MTEDEFRTKMKCLGWDDDYIEATIVNHNLALSYGVEPPSYDTYVGNPPKIESFP